MTKMRFVAIVKYTNGGLTGAIVEAASRGEAWAKLIHNYQDGERVLSVEMSEAIGPTIK